MAKTPWEMAEVGKEFSHQTALFAWAAMARNFGHVVANRPEAYTQAGYAKARVEEQAKGPFANATAYLPIPELKWFHAIKNQGHGDTIRGARSAAEGVRPGVFDMFLPVPSLLAYARFEGGKANERIGFDYHGLYLELKKPGKSVTSPEQLEFQEFARDQGYAAEIVVGWEAARDCLLTYLGKSPA